MTTYIIESPPKMAARPDPAIYIPPPGLAYSRVQKLFAEFFGTFALVMFGAGAICADQFLRNTNMAGLGLLGISLDRKSTRLNSSHRSVSRMPSSA